MLGGAWEQSSSHFSDSCRATALAVVDGRARQHPTSYITGVFANRTYPKVAFESRRKIPGVHDSPRPVFRLVPNMSRLSRVDHLIYGTPDLEDTVDRLERQTGVRAAFGGQHLGHGTRNALIALGSATYLEIMGPDPEQPEPDEPRWLGIDDLDAPRLITWAATASPLAPFVERAVAKGIPLGRVQPGHRRRPDGVDLRWELTDPSVMPAGGLVPFFIDWGSGPHPSDTAPRGIRLVALRAEHPEPSAVESLVQALDLDLEISRGPRAELVATLECPTGTLELR